jgi:hypothetical protein
MGPGLQFHRFCEGAVTGDLAVMGVVRADDLGEQDRPVRAPGGTCLRTTEWQDLCVSGRFMTMFLLHLYFELLCLQYLHRHTETGTAMTTRTTIIGGLAAATLIGGLATAATATVRQTEHGYGPTVAAARLGELNNSNATGAARVTVEKNKVTVVVKVKGLLAKAPHAMHIHAGGMGKCPTMAANTNGDRILSTTEGHHAYGSIVTSLTTRGDTSPASGLAIDRFPATSTFTYKRTITVSASVAKQIHHNNAVIVVHGIDRNRNGVYDFKLGKSDLDPKLPLEATSPALCGALRVQTGR